MATESHGAHISSVAHVRVIQARLASGLNILLGVWSILSPWAFDYASPSDGAAWSSIIIGFLIAFNGGLRCVATHEGCGPSRVNIVLGAWTILTPWIYDFSTEAARLWNSVIVGGAVVALAVWSLSATRTPKHPPV